MVVLILGSISEKEARVIFLANAGLNPGRTGSLVFHRDNASIHRSLLISRSL